MSRKKGIPGVSFSWKRATGISSAKAKLSRQIGIPLSKSGRQRKMGKSMGCCVLVAFIFVGVVAVVAGSARLLQILAS